METLSNRVDSRLRWNDKKENGNSRINPSRATIYSWLIGLLFLSLPFERLLTVEVSGYTLKFSYLFGILLVIYFLYDSIRRKVKEKISTEEVLLLLFPLTAFITLFWTLDFKRSLVISSMFFFMAMIFVVLRRLFDDNKAKSLEKILIWLGVATAIFGIWQFFAGSFDSLSNYSFLRPQYTKELFGFPRIQSTFLEPLYFANFLLIPIGLVIKKIVSARVSFPPLLMSFPRCSSGESTNRVDSRLRGNDKGGSGIDKGRSESGSTNTNNHLRLDFFKLLVIGIAFFLTLSRGAIYALVVGLILVLIWMTIRFKKYLVKYLVSISIIILSLIVGLVMIYSVAGKRGITNYFSQAQNASLSSDEVTNNRLSTTQVAWQTFKSHPFGIGAGAFGALPEYKNNIPSKGYQTVNNLYLEVLVEEGVFGFVFLAGFIVLLVISLINGIRYGDIDDLLYLAILSAILIQYLTFSTLYIIYIWAFLALIWRKASSTAEQQISKTAGQLH